MTHRETLSLMSALIYSSSKTLRPAECVDIAFQINNAIDRVLGPEDIDPDPPASYPHKGANDPPHLFVDCRLMSGLCHLCGSGERDHNLMELRYRSVKIERHLFRNQGRDLAGLCEECGLKFDEGFHVQ